MFFVNLEVLCCVLICLSWTTTFSRHVPRKENYVLKPASGGDDIISELFLNEGAEDEEDVGEEEIVPETEALLEGVPLGVKVLPQYLEAHYYTVYGDLRKADAESAFRPGHVTKTHSCRSVREVPENLRSSRFMRPVIPYFYKKYTETYGIPVVGSENVPDEALKRACYVLRFLLADIKLLREKFFRAYGRVAIIAENENLTDLPEYSFLPDIYNNKTRGLGAIHLAPTSSASEENVLCYANDMYRMEDILIREIAIGIYELAGRYIVKGLEGELKAMYELARESGYWTDTYAEQSKEAYLGEGIQSFFNVNGYSRRPDGLHNRYNTRTKLVGRDVFLYRLIQRLFPCHNNYLTRCSHKIGREHEQELRMDCYGGHMPNIFPVMY